MEGQLLKKRAKGNISDDSPKRNVLIVTGHHALRMSLKDLINLESDLTVGGEATDLTEARRVVGGDHLDLAIVDRPVCTSMGSHNRWFSLRSRRCRSYS